MKKLALMALLLLGCVEENKQVAPPAPAVKGHFQYVGETDFVYEIYDREHSVRCWVYRSTGISCLDDQTWRKLGPSVDMDRAVFSPESGGDE